jgi:SPP1 family predicted phage head-tail adaptor
MALAAGRLRHRVRIDQLVAPVDSFGDPLRGEQGEILDPVWTELATVWAAIEPLSAREFVQSAATQSQVVARIVIRYRDDITAAMRLVHGAKVYNPAGLLADKDSGIEYLTIPVTQGVNDG